jgi:hypothetical protein
MTIVAKAALLIGCFLLLQSACQVPQGTNEITDAVITQQTILLEPGECCCWDNEFGNLAITTHGSQVPGSCFCPNFDSGWCKIYPATYLLQYWPVARPGNLLNIGGGGQWQGHPICVDWSGVAYKCYIDELNQTTCPWSHEDYPQVCNRTVKDYDCVECYQS